MQILMTKLFVEENAAAVATAVRWIPLAHEFFWLREKRVVICVKWKWYAFAFPGIGLNVELVIMFQTSCKLQLRGSWVLASYCRRSLLHYFYRSSLPLLFNDLRLLFSNLLLIFANSLFHRRFSIFHSTVLFESFRPNCKNEKKYKLSSCIQNSKCDGIARHPIVYTMHVFVFVIPSTRELLMLPER